MPLSAQKLALLRRLEDLEGTDSLMDFVVRCDVARAPGATALRPDHLLPLAELFLAAERVGGVRAVVSTPPQHGKTTSILHWMVRYLQRNPRRKLAYVTYSHAIAEDKAREAARIAMAAGLRLEVETLHSWTTSQGGGVKFLSVGGDLTGYTVDLLVVDDPHKNLEEATSTPLTEKIFGWFKSVAFNRLSRVGSAIVNAARWCQTDLIGRLVEDSPGTWKEVNLPAILDEGTRDERALWERVKPLAWLKEFRRQLADPKLWAAMFMGRPVADGGQVFREPRFYRYADLEGDYRIAIGVDVASSPGRGDHSSAFVVSAKDRGADQVVEVLDYYTGQVDLDTLAVELVKLQKRWSAHVYVEVNGVGAGLPALIRRINPEIKVHDVRSINSKYLRAQPAASAWNDGRLRLKEGADYVPDLVRRIRSFTGAGDLRDDDVDALGIAFGAVDRPLVDRGRGVFRLVGS